MATLFYLILVFFGSVPFSLFWLIISIVFSLLETGGRIVYRYTTDRSLAGHEESM